MDRKNGAVLLRRFFCLYNKAKGGDLILWIGILWQLLTVQPEPAPAPRTEIAIKFDIDQIRQEQIDIVLSQPTAAPEPAPAPKKQEQTQTFVVTAFTAGYESTGKRPGDPGYGITASGAHVEEGVTIACPPSIPFGTVIHIKGIGDRVCQDRGSDIVEGHLDLYIKDLDRANQFGRQQLEAIIKG